MGEMQQCMKCGASSATPITDEFAACPRCGAIFSKVRARFEADLLRTQLQEQERRQRAVRLAPYRRTAYVSLTIVEKALHLTGRLIAPMLWFFDRLGCRDDIVTRFKNRPPQTEESKRLNKTVGAAIGLGFLALLAGTAHAMSSTARSGRRKRSSLRRIRDRNNGGLTDTDGDGE